MTGSKSNAPRLTRRAIERGSVAHVVLLTGASIGVGLAIARLLLKDARLHLVLTARGGSMHRFASLGIVPSERVWLRALDVTDAAQRRSVVEEIGDKLGGVDTLINNAGITYRTVAEYATDAELTHQMAVNYEGPMALAALVLPRMRQRRSGHIVQVSSAGGLVAMPTMGLYSASKFALEGASEAMYYELRPFGVQVTMVLPGFIHSPGYLNSVVGPLSRRATRDVGDAYHVHFMSMDRLIGRLMQLTRSSPESVARKVVRSMLRRRTPLRVLATWDARFLWWFRRFFPHPLYVWITYWTLPGIRSWGTAGRSDARRASPSERDAR